MPRPCATEPRSRGFTLLEVLVALAILAVAMAALIRGAASQTDAFAGLRERSIAGWVAENALAELRLQDSLPPTGVRQGTTRMAGREWAWRAEVSDTPAVGIRRVRIEVRAPGSRADAGDPAGTLDGFVDDRLQR